MRQLLPFQHDQADRVVRGDEETWAVLHVGRESVAEIRLTQESLMDGWSDEDRCGIEEWDDRGNSLRGELRIEWRRKPSGPRLASIGKSVEVEVWFLWAKGEASCLRVRGMPGATTFQLRNAIDKRFGRNVEGGWGNRAGDSPWGTPHAGADCLLRCPEAEIFDERHDGGNANYYDWWDCKKQVGARMECRRRCWTRKCRDMRARCGTTQPCDSHTADCPDAHEQPRGGSWGTGGGTGAR